MTEASAQGRGAAARIALYVVVAGLVANTLIARLVHGNQARVLFGNRDWTGDFVKHVISFPGPKLAPSFAPDFIAFFQQRIAAYEGIFGHFHNMPETVLLTLAVRPLFSLIDPLVIYAILATLCAIVWAAVCRRYADPEVRPQALGVALGCYPFLLMIERGNLFSGITTICLLVALARRRQDRLATVLIAIAVNIRPNIAIIVLPLLAWDRATFVFVARTFVLGVVLGFGSLALDTAIYPAYTMSSWLGGLALYNETYVLGPLGAEFVSSLWGALRQWLPASGRIVTLCTLVGLMPFVLAWVWRHRLSYAAACFLCIAASTLSTAVLADYHLMIFVLPLLLLRRDDKAFWPILLGVCWLLIPKNYTPAGVLSWQVYLNPAGLVLAVLGVVWAYRDRLPLRSGAQFVEAQS